ncbi:MAG: VOC family protein [Rubrivivax sp.]
MAHAIAATLYARQAQRLAGFYEQVLALPRQIEEAGFVLLASGSIELVVVQAPAAIAAQIHIAEPPALREDTPIKLAFPVPDVEALRPVIERLGGGLKPPAAAWSWRGATHLDGWDPEGNVFQLRQTGSAGC